MSLDVYLECPCCDSERYWANITHNLRSMADAAGIYELLWRPEELRIASAGDLISGLKDGLARLKADPEKFKAFDSPNGWGLYEHFVPFVEKYLDACLANPRAKVRASR